MSTIFGDLQRIDSGDLEGVDLEGSLRLEAIDSKLRAELDPDQLAKLSSVIGQCELGSEDLKHIEMLLERQVDGVPALLSTDRNGETLLDSLHQISTEEVQAGTILDRDSSVDIEKLMLLREEVVSSLLAETADPARNVNQGDHATCKLVTDQITLCTQAHADYGRMVKELYLNGQTTLMSGETMFLHSGSIQEDTKFSQNAAAWGMEKRGASERLFQGSLMQKAAEFRADFMGGGVAAYDSQRDLTTIRYLNGTSESFNGLHDSSSQYMGYAITGIYKRRLDCLDDPMMQEIALSALEGARLNGETPSISVKYAAGGAHCFHAFNYTDRYMKDGEEMVQLRNAWGKMDDTDAVPSWLRVVDAERGIFEANVEDLKANLRWAMVDDRTVTAPTMRDFQRDIDGATTVVYESPSLSNSPVQGLDLLRRQIEEGVEEDDSRDPARIQTEDPRAGEAGHESPVATAEAEMLVAASIGASGLGFREDEEL